MDIAAWLRGLGLEQYEPAFRYNRIDAEILPKLTVGGLEDIDVVMVGDRGKLLEAIVALRVGAPPPVAVEQLRKDRLTRSAPAIPSRYPRERTSGFAAAMGFEALTTVCATIPPWPGRVRLYVL